MKKGLIGLMIAILFIPAACGCPKIDTSSDEALKASIQKVRESLSEDRRTIFDEALQIIAFNDLNSKPSFLTGPCAINLTEPRIRRVIQGKTGEEIIQQAEQIKKER
jgi:hypothetical protein